MRQHSVQPTSYNRIMVDAGEIRVNYVDAENPGIRLGATRGGNVFTIDPEYHSADVDGAPGPVKGEKRLTAVTVKMEVNIIELVPWALSIGLPGATAEPLPEHIKITRALNLLLSDYGTNLALLGNMHGSSEPIVLIMKNVLSDGNFEIATMDGGESVIKLQFKAHYLPAALDSEPWQILAVTKFDNMFGDIEEDYFDAEIIEDYYEAEAVE